MEKTYRVKPGLKGHTVNGRLYKPGETFKMDERAAVGLEDRLELADEKDGEQTPVVNSTPPVVQPTGPATVAPDRPVQPTPTTADQGPDWRTLPKDVVKALTDGGFDTPDKVRAASDDQLLGVTGIGAAKVKVIREIMA